MTKGSFTWFLAPILSTALALFSCLSFGLPALRALPQCSPHKPADHSQNSCQAKSLPSDTSRYTSDWPSPPIHSLSPCHPTPSANLPPCTEHLHIINVISPWHCGRTNQSLEMARWWDLHNFCPASPNAASPPTQQYAYHSLLQPGSSSYS